MRLHNVLGLLSACFVMHHAHAQTAAAFPTKPMRFIVGFTAGSEVDVIGRMIAHEMGEKWGQRVVVDNRPGAGSTVAGAIVAAANADGYTLFFNTGYPFSSTSGKIAKWPLPSTHQLVEKNIQQLGFSFLTGFTRNRHAVIIWRNNAGPTV